MAYTDYSYTALTQAEFFKAEAELIRFGERLAHSLGARYLKDTLLAIDAIFAIRISHDVTLPVVPLITAFDLSNWKYQGDADQGIRMQRPEFRPPVDSMDAIMQAIHYMQAIQWAAVVSQQDAAITMETVLHLHEILLSGKTGDNRYHGFRNYFLPHKKGFRSHHDPFGDQRIVRIREQRVVLAVGASVHHPLFLREDRAFRHDDRPHGAGACLHAHV